MYIHCDRNPYIDLFWSQLEPLVFDLLAKFSHISWSTWKLSFDVPYYWNVQNFGSSGSKEKLPFVFLWYPFWSESTILTTICENYYLLYSMKSFFCLFVQQNLKEKEVFLNKSSFSSAILKSIKTVFFDGCFYFLPNKIDADLSKTICKFKIPFFNFPFWKLCIDFPKIIECLFMLFLSKLFVYSNSIFGFYMHVLKRQCCLRTESSQRQYRQIQIKSNRTKIFRKY